MPSVYLADPDAFFRESLARALRRYGADVVEFSSGSELSAAAVQNEPDLIVLASDRNEMEGWQVLTRFKCRSTGRPYPFVLVVDRNLSLDEIASSLQDFLTDWSRLCVRSLGGILAWLQGRGRSGRFEVEAFGARGTILLSKGEVLEARWKELRGREAVRFFAEELPEQGFRFAERVGGMEATASAGLDAGDGFPDESGIRPGGGRTPEELARSQANVELARRLLARRQPGEALRLLREAAEGYERQLGDVHYLMALAHLGRGDIAAAVGELQAFRRSLPEDMRPLAAPEAQETAIADARETAVVERGETTILKAKRRAALDLEKRAGLGAQAAAVLQAEGTAARDGNGTAAIEAEPMAAVRTEGPAALETEPAAVRTEGPAALETEPAAVRTEGPAALETEQTSPAHAESPGAVETEQTAAIQADETATRRSWRIPSSVAIAAALVSLVLMSAALAAVLDSSLPGTVVTLLSELRIAGGRSQVPEVAPRLPQTGARRPRGDQQLAGRKAARAQPESTSSPEASAHALVGPGSIAALPEPPLGIETQIAPAKSDGDTAGELRTERETTLEPARTAQEEQRGESLAALRGRPGLRGVDSQPRPRRLLSPRSIRALIDFGSRRIEIIRAWTDSLATEQEANAWVLVDATGRVEDVRLLRSSGLRELDERAIEAVRNVRYAPARRGGVAVPAWVKQTVVFKLD